jgi:DMSO/TMAO reductase YedYZ molybdopterin-dependent catalytic subunit
MQRVADAELTRRRLLRQGLWGAAALSLARFPLEIFGAEGKTGDELIPFLEPQPLEPGKAALHWDTLSDWITPMDQFYGVQHYGVPKDTMEGYKLQIDGLVGKPRSLTLDDLKKLPKKEITATLECSGNGAGKNFIGAIGNARWAGAALAPLLKDCGIAPEAVEIAFWGADHKSEKIRGADYDQNFARTLSIPEASRDELILAYEMNGQPLTAGHGAPVRLVVPGWYGIAWVKWLRRIEVRDHRLMTRFMAKDYVTVRGEELPDGHVNWTESSVGPMNLKSMVAKVIRRQDGSIAILGAAWSGLTPLKAVEVKIDEGEWLSAKIDDSHTEPYTWRFWTIDWKDAKPGEHTLVSRAIDAKANLQPAADDPAIKLKKTYWEANQQWPRKIRI